MLNELLCIMFGHSWKTTNRIEKYGDMRHCEQVCIRCEDHRWVWFGGKYV